MIPFVKTLDALTKFNNDAGGFMTYYNWHRLATLTIDCNQIRVTQSHGFNLDQDFAPLRPIQFHLFDLQGFTFAIRSRQSRFS
jgi:hypothetical protein